jgi:prolyl-tRNA editing enzyme YbaK/EbsC (Cys-tRNA(Pro) deacylase)
LPELHPSCQAVDAILADAGVPGRVRILDQPAPTAPAAAAQVGCEVGAIANSLVFETEAGEPLLIMTSGRHRVDLARMAGAYGIRLHRAAPEFVRTHTGQPIGGVAPVGHPRPIRTLVDRALAEYPQLWAAGGIPHAVFPLTYAELLTLTAGEEVDVN